jgi:UrcA family protein
MRLIKVSGSGLNMRTKIQVLLLSFLAVGGSSLAMASDPFVTVKTETVKYGDLRLISAVGAAVLYGRLTGAAERACGGPLETVPLVQRQRFKQCVDEAIAKAVTDVNNPMLTWYRESKRGNTSENASSGNSVAKAR